MAQEQSRTGDSSGGRATPYANNIDMADAPNSTIELYPSPPSHITEVTDALRAIRYIATRDMNVQMEIFQFDPDELPMPVSTSDAKVLWQRKFKAVAVDPNSQYSYHLLMQRGSDGIGAVPVISQEVQQDITTKILIPLSRYRNPTPSRPHEPGENKDLKERIHQGMDLVAAEIVKTMPKKYGQTKTDYLKDEVKKILLQEFWVPFLSTPYGFTTAEDVRLPM